ncbi:hypothetical protein Tco_1002644 [Tanacetum coccineum]|uniref:Uncharacterized protein n=1 Tax=Tanacetum coccineum TaxID=301880 RepID=A0ABQ5F6X7_9ASTR
MELSYFIDEVLDSGFVQVLTSFITSSEWRCTLEYDALLLQFLELNSLITQEASGSLEDLEIIQDEDTHPYENTSLHHDEDDQEINEP